MGIEFPLTWESNSYRNCIYENRIPVEIFDGRFQPTPFSSNLSNLVASTSISSLLTIPIWVSNAMANPYTTVSFCSLPPPKVNFFLKLSHWFIFRFMGIGGVIDIDVIWVIGVELQVLEGLWIWGRFLISLTLATTWSWQLMPSWCNFEYGSSF